MVCENFQNECALDMIYMGKGNFARFALKMSSGDSILQQAGNIHPGLHESCLTHWGRDKMAVILADGIFKCIFLNENVYTLIQISLKFVPIGSINNINMGSDNVFFRLVGNDD